MEAANTKEFVIKDFNIKILQKVWVIFFQATVLKKR
jgi:hypothetical protein